MDTRWGMDEGKDGPLDGQSETNIPIYTPQQLVVRGGVGGLHHYQRFMGIILSKGNIFIQ